MLQSGDQPASKTTMTIRIPASASARASNAYLGRFRPAICAGLGAALSLLLLTTTSVRGDVNITVQSSAPVGSTGHFDVLLTNIGPATIQVGGFDIELTVAALSGIHFTNATPAPLTATYIFGTDQSPPFVDTGTYPFPNQHFLASDFNFDATTGFVASGATVGLGLVNYSVDPGATGSVPVTLLPTGTTVSDFNLGAINGNPVNGTIRLPSPGTTPEPSSVVLTGFGGLLLVVASWRRMRHRVKPG
jgi:hypothetical protein